MVILSLLLLCVGAENGQGVNEVLLDIPPRFMWGREGDHSGYCGSASTQTVGIFFGEYISQDKVRRSVGTKAERSPEILWRKNFRPALDHFNFDYTFYESKKGSTYANYVVWVKKQLSKGHPVIGGIFEAGPAMQVHNTYDHIVPIVGFKSASSDPSLFLPSDVLYFYDLDENTLQKAEIKDWVKSRTECNELWDGTRDVWCLQESGNFGVAIRGHKDTKDHSLPVRLSGLPSEEPDYSIEDENDENPVLFTADVTCSNLNDGKTYALLRYNNTRHIPKGNLLDPKYEENYDRWWEFQPLTDQKTFTIKDSFLSNSTMFYRCDEIPHHLNLKKRHDGKLKEVQSPINTLMWNTYNGYVMVILCCISLGFCLDLSIREHSKDRYSLLEAKPNFHFEADV